MKNNFALKPSDILKNSLETPAVSNPTLNSAGQKLEWLQALRGVAAMMVLFFHLGAHWVQSSYLAHAIPVIKWGFSGVDVFFVLSGFVVYLSAERLSGRIDAARFFTRRAIRVYFGYWPALLFTVAAFGLLNGAQYHADMKAFVSLLLLSFWPNDHWLGTAWTLSFELYFYVGIALLTCFCKKPHRPVVLALAFTLVAFWNAGLMFSSKPAFIGGAQPLRMWMSAYIMEFLAGALLVHFRQKIKWDPILALIAISLAAVCAAAGSFSEWFDRIEILRVGTFGIAATAIVLIALMLQTQHMAQPPRWLVAVGDSSYSLYLLHPALVLIFYIILDQLQFTDKHVRLLCEILIPIACMVSAYAWFVLIERPLYRWGTGVMLPDTRAV